MEHARALPSPPAGLLLQPAGRRVRQIASPEPAGRTMSGTASAAFGALLSLAAAMTAVAERDRVAAVVPLTAPLFAAMGLPVSAAGLSLGGLETTLGDEGSTKVLTLQGQITNRRSLEATVPNLRIVVRDETGQSLYTWTAPPPHARLGPGEVVDFRSRLVSPPGNGHDVVVSFADRSGGATGTPDRR